MNLNRGSKNLLNDLEDAWSWRKLLGVFDHSTAVRIFHGPGEGQGDSRTLAVDRFGDHYWITVWESESSKQCLETMEREVIEFLKAQGAQSVVGTFRPERHLSIESRVLWGTPVSQRLKVTEYDAQYWVQLLGVRHPGLFLDHAPLRKWLHQHSDNRKVLNTFAYTGSFSIAAAKGHARSVTTLDLSKPMIQWAKENWKLNGLPELLGNFICGDVFEWLPRLKRQQEIFDCIILDPPSFSHGKRSQFSTSDDLERLHALAFDLLAPGGLLITSINSANISWKKYEADICAAAKLKKMEFLVIQKFGLPETFPTRLEIEKHRYLKGLILKRYR